ncbi:MAG: imidazole glycerol phosphate synthase subunit HisH [Candidatus Saccharimonas sp.]|nr:imidazole glycerol phosphate synthase subunit HisH [Planctomycetaceae bacterium]
MISIIDYGMGNLRSVQKAFEKLGTPAEIVTRPAQVRAATKLVLPGVGAFRDAIHELERLELVEPIREYIRDNKPFLGICLGLQLLFDVSYEDGEWPGLGVLPGEVVRFPAQADLKVPHMGWNTLQTVGSPPLLAGLPADASVYFVHSYYVAPRDESVIAARTEYGVPFTSIVSRGNLFATQFHPEKSQKVGLKLLENFAAK